MIAAENTVQQRRLAGSEEAGEDRDGNGPIANAGTGLGHIALLSAEFLLETLLQRIDLGS